CGNNPMLQSLLSVITDAVLVRVHIDMTLDCSALVKDHNIIDEPARKVIVGGIAGIKMEPDFYVCTCVGGEVQRRDLPAAAGSGGSLSITAAERDPRCPRINGNINHAIIPAAFGDIVFSEHQCKRSGRG